MNGAICYKCKNEIGDAEMVTDLMFGAYVIVHKGECPRAENSALNEIDQPSTARRNTMAENDKPVAQTVIDASVDEVAPSRLQLFVNNHPRAAKVAAVTGAIGTAVGGVLLMRTLQSNKEHLATAADHVSAAGSELSASVDPASNEA